MRPDFEALAALIEQESLLSVAKAEDVRSVLDARRRDALALVHGWIAEQTGLGFSPWAVLDNEEGDAYRRLFLLVTAPPTIDQGDFGHCGPAAILVILFTYFPNTMARFAKSLITTGAGQIGSAQIEATAEMLGVTQDDLEIVVPSDGTRPPILPQPLDWMLMAVLKFAMSNDEKDLTGLQQGGASETMVKNLLTNAGVVKDFASERPLLPLADNSVLVGKKDHPLQEILLTCDGAFLEGSGSKVFEVAANHVIWVKDYAHVAPDVEMTYYTWGALETRKYSARTFSRHASTIISFTMKIDAAD